MRILAVSDEECPALWDHYRPGRLDGYDLIVSAGDLKADYLSFLVTMAHAPLLYVRGNFRAVLVDAQIGDGAHEIRQVFTRQRASSSIFF